jgi:hypothetical protein
MKSGTRFSSDAISSADLFIVGGREAPLVDTFADVFGVVEGEAL